MPEKKDGTRTNKRAIWVILAMLAAVGFFPAVCYIYIPLAISNQPPQERDDPRLSIRASAPEWTPDGSRIVFGYLGDIYAVNQDGSSVSRIHGPGDIYDLAQLPTLSGDGSRVWYSEYKGGGLWTRLNSALDGSDVREPGDDFDDREGYRAPGVSPDGSLAAFVKKEYSRQTTVLHLSEYPMEDPREDDGSGWTKLAEGTAIESPRWSPDGRRLAFVKWSAVPNDSRRSALYSTQVVTLSGPNLDTVHQVADGIDEHLERIGGYELAWSPDGTQLLISGSRAPSSVSVVNADGSDFRTLVKLQYNPERQLHASWSPDGSKIAVYNGLGYEGALFTMSPDGSDKRILTQYGDPLLPAQNQAWDPAFNATPTPTPNPAPTPARPGA